MDAAKPYEFTGFGDLDRSFLNTSTPPERRAHAKSGHRPNAKLDPSRSKSPPTIDDFKVGWTLARREQPPEPEQITSKS